MYRSANKKHVGTLPKNSQQLKRILKQTVKKVWERRSHAFPPHYTPDYTPDLG